MTAATEAFWNSQLQNAVIIPGAAEWDEQYAALSRAAAERYGAAEAIPTGADPMQNVWRLGTGRGSHALVFIHGGYWRKFHARDFHFVAATAAAADAAFYNVDYRLMPKVRMTDVVADAIAACEAALEEAEHVVIAGHSAGAHLAVEAALRASRVPAAVVAISGIYDLDPLRHAFIQRELDLTREEVALFSPQERVAAVPCPLHVAVGADESTEFLRQSIRLYEAAQEAQIESTMTFVPERHHFAVVADLAEPASPLTRFVADLLR